MNQSPSRSGPFFKVLTAPGRGAIAVIRVWGTGAVKTVGDAFRAGEAGPLGHAAPGRLLLGRLGEGLGDEVVATVLESALPAVEIQCHGGPAAVAMVLDSLERAGALRDDRWAIPGLDYPAGDPLSAQAIEDLRLAPTVLSAEILLDQVHGALNAEIARLAALVAREPTCARAGLEALIERGAIGLRLISGWKVAIAGRPNVGKSSLFNALCGFPRAIVDSAPGTTRDVVAFQTAFEGWPVELADTAGLRSTADAVENLGIERAHRELGSADLVLLVLDRSEGLRPIDRDLIAGARDAILVANKSDLQPAWDPGDAGLPEATVLAVSAERRAGLGALGASIVARLVPVAPAPGDAVPFRPAHVERLGKARDALVAGHAEQAALELETLIIDGWRAE